MTEQEETNYLFGKVPVNRGFESREKRMLRESVVGLNWDGFDVHQFSQKNNETDARLDQDTDNDIDSSRAKKQ